MHLAEVPVKKRLASEIDGLIVNMQNSFTECIPKPGGKAIDLSLDLHNGKLESLLREQPRLPSSWKKRGWEKKENHLKVNLGAIKLWQKPLTKQKLAIERMLFKFL